MTTPKLLTFFVFLLAALSLTNYLAAAQQHNTDVDQVLDSVRADMRADKVAIITEAMNLGPEEAKKFWPVYREYEAELVQLNDKRIAILKDYAAKYVSMTDSEAKSIADRSFDWETSRTQLRKNYFAKLMKATSAITAAKFFQVEHRLDLVLDLQLATEIPGLFIKSAHPGE